MPLPMPGLETISAPCRMRRPQSTWNRTICSTVSCFPSFREAVSGTRTWGRDTAMNVPAETWENGAVSVSRSMRCVTAAVTAAEDFTAADVCKSSAKMYKRKQGGYNKNVRWIPLQGQKLQKITLKYLSSPF